MNARKAVEPVCLDVLVKWRGDEETGRDQLDEILREVVIITDSEDSDESSDEDDSSDEGELSSASSGEISNPSSRTRMRPACQHVLAATSIASTSEDMRLQPMEPTASMLHPRTGSSLPRYQREKREQRGFKRYQAAWDQALRRQNPKAIPATPIPDIYTSRQGQSDQMSPFHDAKYYSPEPAIMPQYSSSHHAQSHPQAASMVMSGQVSRSNHSYLQLGLLGISPTALMIVGLILLSTRLNV